MIEIACQNAEEHSEYRDARKFSRVLNLFVEIDKITDILAKCEDMATAPKFDDIHHFLLNNTCAPAEVQSDVSQLKATRIVSIAPIAHVLDYMLGRAEATKKATTEVPIE